MEKIVIKVGNMYLYNIGEIDGIITRLEFTSDITIANKYNSKEIGLKQLINNISFYLGCDCLITIYEEKE